MLFVEKLMHYICIFACVFIGIEVIFYPEKVGFMWFQIFTITLFVITCLETTKQLIENAQD